MQTVLTKINFDRMAITEYRAVSGLIGDRSARMEFIARVLAQRHPDAPVTTQLLQKCLWSKVIFFY